MQNLSTRVFKYASVAFGIFGILMILSGGPDGGPDQSTFNMIVQRLFFISIFTILPSFALSVASKYLK